MTMGESHGFMKGVVSDDAESRRVLDAALAAGMHTVDTANIYSEGRSEELLGPLDARQARADHAA